MELLAAYRDDDDGAAVPLQPKVVSKSIELAPFVTPDEAERRLRYVNPHTKELAYNPRLDAVIAPIQGPIDPNSRKALGVEMNTLTGHVEETHVNPVVFNDQFHMFASRKYAHDPAAPALVDGKPVLIGDLRNASKPEAEQEKERHSFMKQKRKQKGDVADPTEYLGPWAPYEVKQLPPIKYPGYVEGSDAAAAAAEQGEAVVQGPQAPPPGTQLKEAEEEEEVVEEQPTKKAATSKTQEPKSAFDQTEREKQLAVAEDIGAKSVLHIPNVRDYQGRTFMVPPSDLKSRPHDCYVPKKVIHTFSGHTKGISVR